MDVERRRAARGASGDVYGRVWTDPRELSPWVVLLDRKGRSTGPGGTRPRIVFRRAGEEWTWPVRGDVRLDELSDDRLRGYLERARAS